MKQLFTKLLIIAAVVGGYDWLVSPFPLRHGHEQPPWVLVGWLVVVCIVYLTWRLEWTSGPAELDRHVPVQQWRVIEDRKRVDLQRLQQVRTKGHELARTNYQ